MDTIGLFFLKRSICALLLSLLLSCAWSRTLGGSHSRWKSHKRHRYSTEDPWDATPRVSKRLPPPSSLDECCPSITEIIQPLGGVSKSGRIFELYQDQNSTQSFYATSCKEGVKGRPCRYVRAPAHATSACVQRYSYTYALVREFVSGEPWRLDYIRVRSGCTCEIRLANHGWPF